MVTRPHVLPQTAIGAGSARRRRTGDRQGVGGQQAMKKG
jgi:hypothetical protein